MQDRTFGYRELTKIGKNSYDNQESQEKFRLFELYEEFLKKKREGDWLINLLCQYGFGTPRIGDALWYLHIQKMINNGSLYMVVYNLDNWAYPDKEIDNNINNLNKIGVDVSLKGKINSDGFWSIKESMILSKVYMDDESTPESLDQIEIIDPNGIIEFGTQKICKSAMSLMMYEPLLRVPYNISIINTPCCAIFYNIPPTN